MSALVGVLIATAAAAAPVAPREQTQDEGLQVYRVHCLACHGALGDGRGPASIALLPRPPDFTQPEFWRERSAEDLQQSIRTGNPEASAMVGFEHLSDAEIRALSIWLETLRPVLN